MTILYYGITGEEIIQIKKFLDGHDVKPDELKHFELVRKPRQKMVLLNHIYKHGPYIFETGYSTKSWEEWGYDNTVFLMTETKEIEVDA